MSHHDAKSKALELTAKQPDSMMGTIDEKGFPCLRVMRTLKVDENFNAYFATARNTRKCNQLKANSKINCFWWDPQTWETVEIVGEAVIVDDKETREKMWNPMFTEYFSGVDDPNFVIIIVKPLNVRLSANMGANVENIQV